jgi:hypothetical protein
MARLSYFKHEEDDPSEYLYVETLFEHNRSWWQRFKVAFMYLFSRRTRYWLDGIVLTPEETKKAIDFMNEFLKETEKGKDSSV